MRINRFSFFVHHAWWGFWIGPYVGEPPDDETEAWDKAWCLYVPGAIFEIVRYRIPKPKEAPML